MNEENNFKERYYAVLGGASQHDVVIIDDIIEWAQWFECAKRNRHVGDTQIGHVRVSTIFLGLNHGCGGQELWFETMIFGDKRFADIQERYARWDEAWVGHQAACRVVRKRNRRRILIWLTAAAILLFYLARGGITDIRTWHVYRENWLRFGGERA